MDISNLDDEAALARLAEEIDKAADSADAHGLEAAIAACGTLQARELDAGDRATCYYFEANAWEALRTLRREGTALWEWEQPEFAQGLLALRRARLHFTEDQPGAHRKGQVLTNLGNALSHTGRVVEAISLWDDALEELDPFPMAQANRGHGLFFYAQRTHDQGHQTYLMHRAYTDLRAALNYHLHPDARAAFERVADAILEFYGEKFLGQDLDLDSHSLGEDEVERTYRNWSLRHALFLMPLNELGSHSVAAADSLVLPSITTGLDEGPMHLGFFNQMKQEYVTARFSLYRGITGSGTHYSDRGVKLINTLDYPVYSRWVEEIKTAFRVAYSIFDKAALFLNDYLRLGIDERRVNFRTLWYVDRNRSKGVREDLSDRQNIALQALFWVSKDLFERMVGFQEVLDPEAKELADIRNHIEHKYLKVHEMDPAPHSEDAGGSSGLADTLAYSVSVGDLRRKAIRLLKMARATLLYLTHAVYLEEVKRQDEHDDLTMPMFLDEYDDEWKT